MSDEKILTLLRGGASYEQIARQLNIPVDEVRAGVERALSRLVLPDSATDAHIELARLDALILALWGNAAQGDVASVRELLNLLDRRNEARQRLPAHSLFPASENTPGQAKSRDAHEYFESVKEQLPWYATYLHYRAEGWDWRKAALIAWKVVPFDLRVPKTQIEFARVVLGLANDRTIRKWLEKDAEISTAIENGRVATTMSEQDEVLAASTAVAKMRTPKATGERRLWLEYHKAIEPAGRLTLAPELIEKAARVYGEGE